MFESSGKEVSVGSVVLSIMAQCKSSRRERFLVSPGKELNDDENDGASVKMGVRRSSERWQDELMCAAGWA